MTPRIVCTCGKWWYEGQTPLCNHMADEVSHEAEAASPADRPREGPREAIETPLQEPIDLQEPR